jgi:hypothetical protein
MMIVKIGKKDKPNETKGFAKTAPISCYHYIPAIYPSQRQRGNCHPASSSGATS